MGVCLITGAAGLVGSESARYFALKNFAIVGIDNDMRQYFFGKNASTDWNRRRLEEDIPGYTHYETDIRDEQEMASIFKEYGTDIELIIHAAAQPSHDWAAREPFVDFSINANGTLVLLEMTRRYCPRAVFIFTSTNKVYGDTPNRLPLIEEKFRWEIDPSHPYSTGIDESMSIDQTKHSLFGASKVAADVVVQEYGRYFDMKTACFRGGCLTGPSHSGAQLHGFLAYLMKCTLEGDPYTIFGYKGKQVRDNLHSQDLAGAFWQFFQHPRVAEVYNMGGGRYSHCSMLEGIRLCEDITGKKLNWTYGDDHRSGDHIWYISDLSKFERHYPDWRITFDLKGILTDIYDGLMERG
ncbi:MAG: NAD-dependent epimerase/dehydratase family protein [Candidatus Latescibacteria bacterium]|nr:NAD-dependent epimerase/dehydratase family protein [Candidatus Latescibacterota bacterium]